MFLEDIGPTDLYGYSKMKILDFRNCFAINTSAIDGVEKNTCRTQLLAKCTLDDNPSGREEEFFLGKECIGEYTYDDAGIAQEPTSEVCIIFSKGDSSLLKKFVNHEDDIIQAGEMSVPRKTFAGPSAYWTDLQFKLTEAEARPLKTSDEIIESTLEGEPMVGRTELIDQARDRSAVLEYPIVYMNVHPPESRFQVDVGPILFPDFESEEERPVQRLQLAYVMYNQLDRAEFSIRVPTRVKEGQSAVTQHYSKVVKMGAKSALYSLKIP